MLFGVILLLVYIETMSTSTESQGNVLQNLDSVLNSCASLAEHQFSPNSSVSIHLNNDLMTTGNGNALLEPSFTPPRVPPGFSDQVDIKLKQLESSLLGEINELRAEVYDLKVNLNVVSGKNVKLRAEVNKYKAKTEELTVKLEAVQPPTNVSNCNKCCCNHNRSRIPVYTGDQSWNIWFNRYVHVSKGLSKSHMLDDILCHLDGKAAEVVFSELNEEIRSDYDSLVNELSSRFADVNVPKVFEMEFDQRYQKSGESLKDYMSALKSLHSKAWPSETGKSRETKLVSRFLKGISDVSVGEWMQINMPNCNEVECVENATRVQATKSIYKRNSESESVAHVNDNLYQRRRHSRRKCYICGRYNHITHTCPERFFDSKYLQLQAMKRSEVERGNYGLPAAPSSAQLGYAMYGDPYAAVRQHPYVSPYTFPPDLRVPPPSRWR